MDLPLLELPTSAVVVPGGMERVKLHRTLTLGWEGYPNYTLLNLIRPSVEVGLNFFFSLADKYFFACLSGDSC